MNTLDLAPTLATLFSELVDGAPPAGAYMLNRGDPGLLASLDRLSASAASTAAPGGSTVAAHADHLRFGLSLMNRWAAGEPNPWADADWSASWQRVAVSVDEWAQLRAELREQAHGWLAALRTPHEVGDMELSGMIGSIAHLAYHMGAIRQIDRTARGPQAND